MSDSSHDRRMLGALLQHPLQALVTEVQRGLETEGFSDLRPAHSAVFVNLGTEGVRISDLADRAGMTKQSMGALISYLENHGYVSVVPDPADGRAKIVRRTKKGMDSNEPARRNIARVQEKWRRLLDPGEMDELVRLLRKLNDRLADQQSSRPYKEEPYKDTGDRRANRVTEVSRARGTRRTQKNTRGHEGERN